MEFLPFLARVRIICITTVAVLNLQNANMWSAAQTKNPVCNNADCQLLGNIYLKHMNNTLNPCDDFYEYVCHGWGTQHPRPDTEDVWNYEIVLIQRARKELKKILENRKLEPGLAEQAKAIYRACMQLPYMQKSDPEIIKNIVARVGNWPMFFPKNMELPPNLPWWAIDNEYIKKTGESALFDFHLVGDPNLDNKIITQVKRLTSPYGMLIRLVGWEYFSNHKSSYKSFLNKVINSVASQNPAPFKSIIEKDLNDVMNFRDSLREIIGEVNMETMETMKIRKLQEWYTTKVETAKINWLETIRTIHRNGKDPSGLVISGESLVNVQKPYFVKLAALLGKTKKRVIVNHIHLYFAERHILLSPDMIQDLQGSISNDANPNGRIRYEIPRWQSCIENHSMGVTMRKMYAKAVFPITSVIDVTNLIEEAKDLLQRQVVGSTWLDEDTKGKSVVKVKAITKSVGYPDWFRPSGQNVPRDVDDVDPLDPDVYFVPPNNRLYVSASYLQPPIYSPQAPYVIKYGSTVSLLGHELYHALDEDGTQYNQDGKTPWWPESMRKEWKKQARCFNDQYTMYRYNEIKKYNLHLRQVLPSTLVEDIADVMGLKLAYNGYREKLAENKGVCPVLPGFENVDCEKLFFIAFANVFCSTAALKGVKRTFLVDPHSLERIRVNGAVSNMKEFSTAFSCKSTDALNIKTRCNIWKK